MTKSRGRNVSRREFVKLTGAGLAAAGLGPLLQACAPSATPTATTAAATAGPVATEAPTVAPTSVPPQTLNEWWWGEQEAPGLEKWMTEAIAAFKKDTGHTISATLQDTAVVISEFQTASAANNAPDIQFFWNGMYHMESAWLGYMEPLDGLIPADALKATNPTSMSVYQGKTYRTGWYEVGLLWLYNKDMFDKAGWNADQPPATWDELMSLGDKLKSKSFTPIVLGLKDGYIGEWWMGHGLGQNLDTAGDAINLFNGKLDWREPKYYEHWKRLGDLWKAKFINDDAMSIELYPGIDLWGNGKGAMTAVVVPLVGSQEAKLGTDKTGLMTFPVFGTGKMAGKPIRDCQGFGISSQSKHKEVAAQFLQYMHKPELVSKLWDYAKVLPTDSGFDPSLITDPVMKALRAKWGGPEAVPYISDLMPVLFWTDAMFVNSQKIITGEFTAEQAGKNAYDVTKKWVEQNPDEVPKYSAWATDLAL